MKIFGSISRLVAILYRKDSQDITLRPNQATTYTAARDVQLPPGDAAHVLTSANSTQTLSNKSISGSSNTITNVSLTTGVTGTLPVANGGTNSAASLNNNRVIQSNGGALVEAAAITAARALISDANGIPVHSAVTSTELGYVSGVTSAIQTQINSKVSKAGDTMTGALLIDNQNELRLGELDASGTAYVAIKAPADLTGGTGTYTLTLPADDGLSGQFLKTDGSGVLAWQTVSAFASFEADWLLIDGATKAITHNLGTKDIQVEIYDTVDDTTIFVDSVVRTSTNIVTLTASEAPSVSWRVTIHAS